MVLLTRPDGKPWVWLDAHPVTVGAYRALDPHHAQGAARDDEWATGVTYEQAREFAASRGGRLARSVEWDAATAHQGFSFDNALVEWVESVDGKKQVNALTRHEIRPDKPQPDVTFRVAREP
jgi:formylglycine-generating enzyme required for sulfatase activity